MQQQHETIQKDQFIRLDSVSSQTTLSKRFLRSDIAKGLFPRPIKLGERLSVFLQSEVDAIINARINGNSPEAIKALVIELEAQRKSTGGKV
jgi:prophage regulatory protein